MAEEELEFRVTLEDGVSKPAREASDSLKGLADGFIKAIEPTEVLKDAFKDVGAGLREMASGFAKGEAKEVVSGLTESFAGLASMLDLIVPGLGQAASAIIRFGGAVASATVGIVQEMVTMAIEATTGKQQMLAMFGALAGGTEQGAKIEEMLGDLSDQIGITKDELAPFAKQFMAMGITGEDALRKMTLAAVSANAIMGDPSAAMAFETLEKKIQLAVQTGQKLQIPAKGLQQLAQMGLTVDDVAKQMNVSSAKLAAGLKAGTVDAKSFGDALQEALIAKGAGPLQKMAMSMGNLKKMLSQSIEDMFEDMSADVEPFLAAIKDLFSVFSQALPSGKAMKAGIGGALHYVFQVLTATIKPLKHFFLDLIIWSLQTYIVFKKNWAGIAPIIKLLGFGVTFLWGQFRGFVRTVFLNIQMVAAFAGALQRAAAWVMSLGSSLYESGKAFVDGFVKGIRDGIAGVVTAAQDVGAAAKKGVTDFLGISSPSKVMLQLGAHTASGFSGGINAGMGGVVSAGSSMGGAAVGGTISGASGAQGVGGGGQTDIVINITAPNGVTGALELTEVAVATLFERLRLQQGLGA